MVAAQAKANALKEMDPVVPMMIVKKIWNVLLTKQPAALTPAATLFGQIGSYQTIVALVLRMRLKQKLITRGITEPAAFLQYADQAMNMKDLKLVKRWMEPGVVILETGKPVTVQLVPRQDQDLVTIPSQNTEENLVKEQCLKFDFVMNVT